MAGVRDLLSIKGTVTDHGYYDPVSGFTVFKIRAQKNKKTLVNCSGVTDDGHPPMGAAIEVFGRYDPNSKFKGIQFKMTAMSVLCGATVKQVTDFLVSIAKHLGREKADRIAKHFQDEDLEHLIEHEPERLSEVDGIGETIISNISVGWDENRALRSIKIFLMKLGLSEYRIKQIISHHGPEYEAVLKKDPYMLSQEGLGFSACDSVAEKIGISSSSPVRYKGFIRDRLRNSIKMNGHLFLTLKEITRDFNTYNGDNPNRVFDSEGISKVMIEPYLVDLIEQGYVVCDDGAYYDFKWFFFEDKSAELLHKTLGTGAAEVFSDINPDEFIRMYEEEESISMKDFKLGVAQEDAVRSFLSEKVMIVTGGPGTGKTTVVKAFVKALDDTKVSYSLMAPTGKAAKRLAITTGRPAHTIHRRMGYKGSTWDYCAVNKLDADAVIIDEFSMVDQEILYRLLDGLKAQTKIVIVGDEFQLPSVGPGNVLKDLIACGKIRTITLDKIHRQSEASDIVKAAAEIKEGNSSLNYFSRNDTKADVSFITTGNDITMAEDYIVQMAQSFKKKNEPGLFQVITPRNEGNLSVKSLNILLQDALNPEVNTGGIKKRQILLDRDTVIRKGDRVLIIKNAYNLGVFNGDTGKVIDITPENLKVALESPDGDAIVAIPLQKVKEMVKLGYAMTVHKVQGSEFPVVILPLIRAHGRMLLQRNLIYTALTRAKKKVFILGQESAIQLAIENGDTRDRNTKLSARIQSRNKPGSSPVMQKVLSLGDRCENSKAVKALLFPHVSAEAFRQQAVYSPF